MNKKWEGPIFDIRVALRKVRVWKGVCNLYSQFYKEEVEDLELYGANDDDLNFVRKQARKYKNKYQKGIRKLQKYIEVFRQEFDNSYDATIDYLVRWISPDLLEYLE
jgi:hypothetical protein